MIMNEVKYTEKEFFTCNFCGCNTNANLRRCCDKGYEEDCNKNKPMNKLEIPILNKEGFTKLLIKHLVKLYKDYNIEEVVESALKEGMPKLDFENLTKCLKPLFIYLPTVAVDFGDSEFYWVVSGNDAMLVKKIE